MPKPKSLACCFFTLFLIKGAARAALPPDVAQQKTLALLKDLISLDTSDPPGNEMKVVQFVKPLLEEDGIEVQTFEPQPGRGNLWARLKGSGKEKPFLIMAHIDVVPAKKEDWKSDPFKAEEREGYLYGRGAIDDKGMASAAVIAMKTLAREKAALSRDVILVLESDEEARGKYGMEWILENHPELVSADVFLNEGGTIDIEDGRITQARVQNYEKLYMDVTLSAEGPSGHSSVPQPDNAVVTIAKAVAKVGAHRFPAALNEVTRAYFKGLSQIPNHPLAKEFATVSSQSKGRAFEKAVAKLSETPQYNASLRTTCTPTVIEAGFKNSAIPGKAKANVNCRFLPTDDPKDVLAQLKKVIDDPKVAFTLPEEPEKPAMSPFGDPFFDSIKKVIREMAPQAVVVPYMSVGATDSRKLRAKGFKAYGLMPMPMAAEDKLRMHGNDERAPLPSVGFAAEFLYRLVTEFAGSGTR